jgi:hypothetical protein
MPTGRTGDGAGVGAPVHRPGTVPRRGHRRAAGGSNRVAGSAGSRRGARRPRASGMASTSRGLAPEPARPGAAFSQCVGYTAAHGHPAPRRARHRDHSARNTRRRRRHSVRGTRAGAVRRPAAGAVAAQQGPGHPALLPARRRGLPGRPRPPEPPAGHARRSAGLGAGAHRQGRHPPGGHRRREVAAHVRPPDRLPPRQRGGRPSRCRRPRTTWPRASSTGRPPSACWTGRPPPATGRCCASCAPGGCG